jgi:hypothetical protein
MNSASHNVELAAAHPDSPSLDESTKPAILLELERVLGSQAFRSSDRSRQFLAYVVHNSLAGQTDNLKERSIGVAVYHRKADYATGEDPVVRISAGEVRKRLEQYYGSAPPDTTLRIEIPRGSYAPEFHWNSKLSAASISDPGPLAADGQPAAQPGSAGTLSIAAVPSASREATKPSENIRGTNFRLLMAIALIGTLTLGCLLLWLQLRALHHSVSEWRYKPATRALWAGFLDSSQDTDVVTEDSSYLLLQSISKQRFSLQDYLNQDYVSQILRNSSGDLGTALNLIATKDLGRADDIKLVQRIVALDPLGSKLHTYSARTYTPALASAHNMIVVGGELSNPWAELFDNRMNFISDSRSVNPGQTVIRNRTPAAGEQEVYGPLSSEKPTVEYCSIAYLPTPNHSGRILAIEGTSWVATDAGVEFLLSEDQLAALLKKIHSSEFPYFNVLLKTTKVANTPLDTTIEAYRTYPDLR